MREEVIHSNGFYFFSGVHSFLLGLFPFFLPVYLLSKGYSLSLICCFIGLTGIFFVLTLFLWDRQRFIVPFVTTVILSFAAELGLLLLLTVEWSGGPLLLLALLNGIYSCLFWMIQRLLFFDLVSSSDSGRKFGNFQILVTIGLKAGVLTGGFVLEQVGIWGVALLSFTSVIVILTLIRGKRVAMHAPRQLNSQQPFTLSRLARYTDSSRSKLVFAFDGIFLYLESYFWLISLFYFSRQSFWQLGLLVIALALFFLITFWMIKNRIDSLPLQRVYLLGVFLYAGSWLLRSEVDQSASQAELYMLLIVIGFCTSFFRLTFNKRFFDLARGAGGPAYIFLKSYISQSALALFFLMLALVLRESTDIFTTLQEIYLVAALASLCYALYGYKIGNDDEGDAKPSVR